MLHCVVAAQNFCNNNNNNGNFLFPTNTTIHDDTHHSQLGMMGKFTSSN